MNLSGLQCLFSFSKNAKLYVRLMLRRTELLKFFGDKMVKIMMVMDMVVVMVMVIGE